VKNYFYILLLLFCFHSSKAQQITGKVAGKNDKGSTDVLTGASVYYQSTTIGTFTDSVGSFKIASPETLPAKLIISLVGYISDTITIDKPEQKELKIVLKNMLTLKEVNVVAKQGSTLYSSVNLINTEVIGGKELLKAACCNLSESFTTNASVDVAFTDAVSGAKKIQMLGLDGVYTQILSENMPLLRGLSAAYGLNYIPGTWIEKIMVTKGTGSVVNGYESISGQINLEFLKPETIKNRFYVNVYASDKGRSEVNLYFNKKYNAKWSTLLFTSVSDMSHKQDRNNDSFLDMPLTRQYNIFNRWDYKSGKKLTAQFGIKALMENRRGGQSNFNYNTDYKTNRSYGIGINTNSMDYFSKTGYLFEKPGRSIGLQTSGKWQMQDMYFGLRRYNGEEKYFYSNLIFADILKTTDHKYKLGLNYIYDNYNEKFNDSTFKRTEQVPGVFGEYTYTHAENFSLVAGIRADNHNLYGLQYTPRLHIRFNPTKSTTLRLSGGRGFRTSNIFVENQSVFASSRVIEIKETFKPEIAWNYGVTLNQKFKIMDNEAFVNFDFFRTDFENQIIMDLDQHVNKVVFYNLNGKSYSNSFQADFGFEPIRDLAVKLAYKWYEVKTTYNYELLDKPFIPKHRIMANLSYSTYREIWKFDFTTNWFGQCRLPSTVLSPVEYQLPKESNDYFLLQAQITKKFKLFELYLGCENILDYVQRNPIVAADNPFGPNFDASMVYAPLEGRTIYFGIRLSIK